MRKLTQEEFEEKSKNVHNGKYTKFGVYNGRRNYVDIYCPIHGWFKQRASEHLNGCGCQKCGNGKKSKHKNDYSLRKNPTKMDTCKFKERAKLIHNDSIIYDKVNYINAHTKVCLICKIHGEFWQSPNSHLQGHSCPKCAVLASSNKRRCDLNDFITKSKQIHFDKYIYSEVEYINNISYVGIICPKHGKFWQIPSNHLSGYGCPKCNSSHLEIEMRQFLIENDINFTEQYHPQWMGLQSLDFYLPDYKVGIECQGKQHFEEGCTFGGNETLDMIIDRDKRKLQKCNDNGVKLLYYSNLGIEYPYQVFEDKQILLDIILGTK